MENVWDEGLAEALIGSTLLVGLTYVQPDGERLEQIFGRVLAADRNGVTIELAGQRAGDFFHLPPDLRSVQRADPGEYLLKSTGEVVTDPDYVCRWTIHSPSH